MSDHLIPGDEAFHNDKQLMAELTALNGQLSRYALRMLDADAKRAQPVSVTEEQTLAQALRTMADRLQERVDRRAGPVVPPALEGDATLRRQIGSRPSERC